MVYSWGTSWYSHDEERKVIVWNYQDVIEIWLFHKNQVWERCNRIMDFYRVKWLKKLMWFNIAYYVVGLKKNSIGFLGDVQQQQQCLSPKIWGWLWILDRLFDVRRKKNICFESSKYICKLRIFICFSSLLSSFWHPKKSEDTQNVGLFFLAQISFWYTVELSIVNYIHSGEKPFSTQL